jgi:hypothetical protein
MLAEIAEAGLQYLAALQRQSVRVGGVNLQLSGPSPGDVAFSAGLAPFRAADANPEIEVNVEWESRLRGERREKLFDSGAVWSLSREGGHYVFDFCSPPISPHPYKRLWVNENFSRARMLLSEEVLDAHRPVFSLEYPADELLITNHLAVHGLGVEVHGCGLVDAETGGHLLLGHSGAGKSTTARLWQRRRHPEVLSDDRIILRFERDGLWMHGTPWHGEGCFASPGKARVEQIFILQHGARNGFSELPPSRAAGELFARSFPPFHSPMGLQATVEFLERIVGAVPCYEFQFVPAASAVDAVLEFSHVATIG